MPDIVPPSILSEACKCFSSSIKSAGALNTFQPLDDQTTEARQGNQDPYVRRAQSLLPVKIQLPQRHYMASCKLSLLSTFA